MPGADGEAALGLIPTAQLKVWGSFEGICIEAWEPEDQACTFMWNQATPKIPPCLRMASATLARDQCFCQYAAGSITCFLPVKTNTAKAWHVLKLFGQTLKH